MVNSEMLEVLRRTGHEDGCKCTQCKVGRGELSQNTATTEQTLVATRAGGCNCGSKASPQVNADVQRIISGLLEALNSQQKRRDDTKVLKASDRPTLTAADIADFKTLAYGNGTQQQQPAPVINDAYFASSAFNNLSPMTQVYLLGEYRRQQNLDNPEDTLPDLRSSDMTSTATVDPPVSDAEDIIPPVNNNYEMWAEEDRQSRHQRRR